MYFDDPQTMYLNEALREEYLEQIAKERHRAAHEPIREFTLTEQRRLRRVIFGVVCIFVLVVVLAATFS